MSDKSTRDRRVAHVDNPRFIELTVPERALEFFLDEPHPGHIHILRFAMSKKDEDVQFKQEGVLIGQSDSPEAPSDADWSGTTSALRILSEIDLGSVETRICPKTGKPLSQIGQINTDPIVFVNFDPATHQFRKIEDAD